MFISGTAFGETCGWYGEQTQLGSGRPPAGDPEWEKRATGTRDGAEEFQISLLIPLTMWLFKIENSSAMIIENGGMLQIQNGGKSQKSKEESILIQKIVDHN